MPKWEKQRQYYDDIHHRWININQNPTIRAIHIYVYEKNRIVVECIFNDTDQKIFQEVKRKGFADKIRVDMLVLKKDDIGTRTDFIAYVDKLDSLDEIKLEIFALLGIKRPAEEIHQEILNLTQAKQFDTALAKAKEYQADGYQDAVWILAEYLSNNGHAEQAYQSYQAIPDTNIHSTEANEKLVYFIYDTFNAHNTLDLTINLPIEEIIAYREEQFRFALKVGNKIQNNIDNIYHFLCGSEGPAKIKNVKGDADTLIETAREMRELRAQVKQSTAALDAAAQSATSTDFFAKPPEEKIKNQQPSGRPRSMSAPSVIKR